MQMMKNALLFSVLLASLAANAEIKLPSFQTLCKYDGDCTKTDKIIDGQFQAKLPPVELIRDYYGHLRPLIVAIARQYQIDPVTLVAAPLAENTMNVKSLKGKVEGYFDGSEDQVDDDGYLTNPLLRTMYNKPLSVGPGQIYVYAAKHVEKLAAAIEGRPVRTKGKEIKQALFTPEGALRYAAAILRDAQEQYGRAGIDISHRPEILATLYNIGRVPETLRRTLQEKREPYPNYFGFWVGSNYRYIQEQLKLPSIVE